MKSAICEDRGFFLCYLQIVTFPDFRHVQRFITQKMRKMASGSE